MTSRIAALVAASVLIAVVIILASSSATYESVPATSNPSEVVAKPKPKSTPLEEEQTEQIARPAEEKKVKGLPVPKPEEVKIVKRPEPTPQEKVAKAEPAQEKKPEAEVTPKPLPEPVPEKLAQKPEPSALDTAKKELPKPAPEVPSEKDKLAVKLASADAEIFKKLYRDALFSVIAQEQELIKQAQKAPKFDPILGRPIQPGAPAAPPAPKPEAPKEEPKQNPTANPSAPPPLPRIDKLRKEGKVPEKEPSTEPKQDSTPPPLPRIDKLRKEGKIPDAPPKDETKTEPKEQPKEQPKSEPKKGMPQPAMPKPTVPAGPAKRGIVQIPEITKEQFKKLAKAAGFEPVTVPGVKFGVILARADKVEDSGKNSVAHLFYYYGKAGFSVFERETVRTDKKNSYQVLYNGKGKTRTLMWAAGGREFVLVAQKLSKRQMHAIEASVRGLFE
jgi:hypothetical protein